MRKFPSSSGPSATPREIAVGVGTALVLAVALSLALMLTVLVASLSPSHAAAGAAPRLDVAAARERPPIAELPAAVMAAEPAPLARYPRLDAAALGPAVTAGPGDHRLGLIVVALMLFGWAMAVPDLWHMLSNRVKSSMQVGH